MSAERCGRCGAPGSRLGLCAVCLLSSAPEAERVGGTELLEELGRGGMGTVYRARHVALGREVAVKLLDADASGPEARARFEREARVLASLQHPNIVALHDFGEDEGQPYLVMELAPGEALSRRLPLPPVQAQRVALQICEALAYAHARGVVHRDLKPANVLVDDALGVKVADFGIARVAGDAGSALTAAHQVVGTEGYLAPEVLAGAAPDPRQDVYALGVLLHELLTGRRPTPGAAEATGPLAALVRRACAVDPAQRYPSARELLHDLRRAGAGEDLHLPPEEALWMRAVAVLLALAVALTLWALVLSLTPRVVPADALLPLTFVLPAQLADGRWVTRARFELVPVLVALGGWGLALAGYALLRRHWRREGLDAPAPGAPLRESRTVLLLGLLALALHALYRLLPASSAAVFVPLLGGVLELLLLHAACLAWLESRRRARPLRREPLLWAGLLMGLAPPVAELLGYLERWRP